MALIEMSARRNEEGMGKQSLLYVSC